MRADRAALRDYFVTAFKVLPGLKVDFGDQLIRLYGDTAVNSGYYTFSYVKDGETKTLPARYSFKTDAADAEAVCEAVMRPTMRFVPIKSPEQQAALSMHRTRDLLVKRRTQLVNMIRGLLAEFSIDIPSGSNGRC